MLKELAEKAKKIDVKELALQVAKANAGLILDNVRFQLVQGIAGDGGRTGRYKSLEYARMKAKISRAPFGVADMKLTGELFKNLYAEVEYSGVTVDSNVFYSIDNINRYGERIYENTAKNAEKVKDKNSVQIVTEYAKALGL